jgi:hypothetical protein
MLCPFMHSRGARLLRSIAERQRRAAGRRGLMTLTDRDPHDIGIMSLASFGCPWEDGPCDCRLLL